MRYCKSCVIALVLGVAVLAVGAQQRPTLAGRWEGVLTPDASVGSRELGARREGPRLATVVVITGSQGNYTGKWTSVSQGNATTDIYAYTMSIWERLHRPFLASADAEADPVRRIHAYRRTIEVDYACELAHQKLADVARSLARQLHPPLSDRA